jgi:hypothetical protein
MRANHKEWLPPRSAKEAKSISREIDNLMDSLAIYDDEIINAHLKLLKAEIDNNEADASIDEDVNYLYTFLQAKKDEAEGQMLLFFDIVGKIEEE